MNDIAKNRIIEEIAAAIDIPISAYQKAEARYKDLGEWFSGTASCRKFNPHIHPQGSFRLGTVVHPLDDKGDYDLDINCRLRAGVTKSNCTQEQLKKMVGADLEGYRAARGIKERKEEKHRCWRLKYADTLNFHLDTVPSIPETSERRQVIQEAIIRTGTPPALSKLVADLAGAITEDRLWNYRIIDDGWLLSNSEGFALWFESRMRLAKALIENLAKMARAARVDELPAYRWKSPLQRCVQLLKRHRDIYFKNDPDGKPASIIITTLSARAYLGEVNIADALDTILLTMGKFVNQANPRVPNPVDPAEDFADRWNIPASSHLNLEKKFWAWLRRAQLDFKAIGDERKPDLLVEAVREKLGATLNPKALIGSGLLKSAAVPAGLSFPDKPLVPKKPAGFA
jgi:hypothetical protein